MPPVVSRDDRPHPVAGWRPFPYRRINGDEGDDDVHGFVGCPLRPPISDRRHQIDVAQSGRDPEHERVEPFVEVVDARNPPSLGTAPLLNRDDGREITLLHAVDPTDRPRHPLWDGVGSDHHGDTQGRLMRTGSTSALSHYRSVLDGETPTRIPSSRS